MTQDDLPPDLSAVRSVGSPMETKRSIGPNDTESIDWTYWQNLAMVSYTDACILSCGFDPRTIRNAALPRDLKTKLDRRKSIANSHLGEQLPSHATDSDRYYGVGNATGVRLSEFRAWGESLPNPLTFPKEFPEAVPQTQDASARTWPWGSHETELLRKLAAAAARFWVNYDPSDPTTAETNERVVEWLKKEQGVSKRCAEVMAQILRADGLRTGPR